MPLQRIVDEASVVFSDDIGKIKEYGRLHDDTVPALREQIGRHRQCIQNIRRAQDMVWLEVPAVPRLHPPGQGWQQRIRHRFIPEHPMGGPIIQGLRDARRHAEIHVGHTRRKQIHPVIAQHDPVVFQRGNVAPVDGFVKIELMHGDHP